ncbi:MAG: VTT domain-containing protein [Planctomycetota bacterium]
MRNPLKSLYNWVLTWAQSPFGAWALFILAFAESSFFPIPPDVLLIALGISIPVKSFRYALICSIGSVLGGMFGYLIGWQFWQWMGEFFFNNLGSVGFTRANFDLVQKLYSDNAFLAVFTAAFTPIPYKVFTIAAGVFNIDFGIFVLASAIGRPLRFFMVAAIVYFGGAPAKRFIERYFNLLTSIFVILIILGFIVIKFLVR